MAILLNTTNSKLKALDPGNSSLMAIVTSNQVIGLFF